MSFRPTTQSIHAFIPPHPITPSHHNKRYDSISTFIYACGPKGGANSIDRYNDIPCEVDEELQVGQSVSQPVRPSLH